ncbi:MAG: hypothetical protein PHV51_08220 [Methanosarcinaceae archaeon]|nr:hypothetical protein [Methanosarcinaceae archaeon]
MVDADGTNQTQLTNTSYREWYLNVDPTGKYIVYSSGESGSDELWLRNMDGSYKVRLTYGVGMHDAFPHWSPDGSKIAFVGHNPGNGVGDIAVITLGGPFGAEPADTKAPIINITWPSRNQTVYEPEITIKGTASDSESGVKEVLVNGLVANGTENWSAEVKLVECKNTIEVIARDFAGNENKNELYVNYVPHNSLHVFDNFSTDSGQWEYVGNAYRDEGNGYVVLTKPVNDQVGVIWFKPGVDSKFTAEFRYKAGGGSGADGIVFMFYKNKNYYPYGGGNLGFSRYYKGSIPGYGVEFDNYNNSEIDPSSRHIALIKDSVSCHVIYVNDSRTEDNCWHDVKITVDETGLLMELDGSELLSWNGSFDRTYSGFGFSGATAGDNNWHLIDDVRIIRASDENDTIPPASISNLSCESIGDSWINWTWKNPSNADFSYSEIYLNGLFQTNTSAEFFNSTGLQPATNYTISTRTVDTHGNINETWVNSTATTKKAGGDDWNPWNDSESEEGEIITTSELQEAVYYWLNDIPVPKTGETLKTERLQKIIDCWLNG